MGFKQENEIISLLETGDVYKKFIEITETALRNQWKFFIHSKIIPYIYKNFGKSFVARKKREMRKSVSPEKFDRDAINRAILSGKVRALKTLEDHIVEELGTSNSLRNVMRYGNAYNIYLQTNMKYAENLELEKIKNYRKEVEFIPKKTYNDAVSARSQVFFSGVDDYSRRSFSRRLIMGMDNEEDIDSISTGLIEYGDSLAKSRSERITLNETMFAVEFMRQVTAKENGVNWKTWDVFGDERTCSLCMSLLGMRARVGSPFPNGVSMPPIHINCRCSLEYDYGSIESVGEEGYEE